MANIWTENWDSYSTGVLWSTTTPTGWSTLSGGGLTSQDLYTNNSGVPVLSSPNVLKMAASGPITFYNYKSGQTDGNNGDSSITSKFYWPTIGANTEWIGVFLRANGVPTLSGKVSYIAIFGAGGVKLQWQTANTVTQIGSTVGAGAFASGIWYVIKLTATGASPTNLTVQVQRLSDNNYLTSSGTWSASQQNCISATDSNIGAGAGFGGIKGDQVNHTVLSDDGSFDTAAASSPATALTVTGPSAGNINTPSTNFTVTLSPTPGTTTGDVTVTPHSSLAGSFTPSTVTLNTATQSATFTFTPTANGAHSITVTNNGGLTNPSANTYTVTTPAITPGVVSVYVPPYVRNTNLSATTSFATDSNAPSSSKVVIQSTAPTGGANGTTVNFTGQWQVATTPNGSYSNLGSSFTIPAGTTVTKTLTPSDVPAGVTKWYRLVATDTAATSANSLNLAVTMWEDPIIIGVAGDSTFANVVTGNLHPTQGDGLFSNQGGNGSTQGFIGAFLQYMLANRYIPDTYLRSSSAYNGLGQSLAATYARQWDPSDVTNHYTSASWTNVWSGAGVTDVIVMLGMNDLISGGGGGTTFDTPTNYKTHMQAISDYLTSRGVRVTLVYPYPPNSQLFASIANFSVFTQTQIDDANTQAPNYWAKLDEIKAADTTGLVRVIGSTCKVAMRNSTALMSDGVHPSALGQQVLAHGLAQEFVKAWFGTAGGRRPSFRVLG